MTRLTHAALLGLVLVAGCTSGALPSDGATPTAVRPSVSPVVGSVSPTGGVLPGDLAAAIVADAAALSGVDPADVVIVSAAATTWNDGALGCPEPGQNYTQSLVDGYQVIVAAGDDEFDYRIGSSASFRRCEAFQPGG